jgi:hypothetical protein
VQPRVDDRELDPRAKRGARVTVYVNSSFDVVSVESGP